MYPRVKRVHRHGRTYEYLQVVEGRREGGRVAQRVVATLGRVDELKASGQLDRWAASLTRLDPPAVGTRREVGPLLLAGHYLDRLGVGEVVDRFAPMRGRAQLTHGEVISALVANRLSAPSPLYDVAGWASSHAVAERLGVPAGLLNDDRLGRALEALAPVAGDVRGALLLRAVERFSAVDARRLHLDLTTVRFAGAYESSSLVAKGWGADRQVARQVRTLQAATPEGVSLYLAPHKGSAAEVTELSTALERLSGLLPQAPAVVADSALGHLGNLAAADRAGVEFVVPLRADTGWQHAFDRDVGSLAGLPELDYTSQREQQRPPQQRITWRGRLEPFSFTDPQTGQRCSLRVAYIWSSEEATSVAEARERALDKAEATLARVHRGLGTPHYRSREQVTAKVAKTIGANIAGLLHTEVGEDDRGRPTLSWWRDQAAIDAAARTDGLYALATNRADLPDRPLSAEDVLTVYKDQWVVEQRHRDAKQTLRVRPVFLHNDDRIDALVSVVGLALFIFGLLEADVRRRLPADDPTLPGLLPEGRPAKPTGRNILATFAGLGLTYTDTGPVLDPLTPTQRRILALLDIPLPWPEHAD